MPTCIETPATPAVVGNPAYNEVVRVAGWGAGANTVRVCTRDCYLSWEVNDECVGTVTGFCAVDRISHHYSDITHGIYTTSNNGAKVAQVVERGVLKGNLTSFNSGDIFYIRRVQGNVEYYIDGVRLYVSTVRSIGPIRSGAGLYLSGDLII